MNGFLKRLRGAFDDPNPIVVKELRSVFRTKLYVRFLYLSAFAIGALVLLIGATIVDGRISDSATDHTVLLEMIDVGSGQTVATARGRLPKNLIACVRAATP